MRNKVLAVLLLGLGVLLSSPSSAVAAEFHYFYATLEGQASFVPPGGPGSLDRCNANLTSEGEFPGYFISGFDTGGGIATFLGSYTFQSSVCLALESPLTPQGEVTFVAANGDSLEAVFENTVTPSDDPTTVILSGSQTIVGGTGRFSGAGGDQQCRFTFNVVTLRVSGTCAGVISF